MATAGYSGTPLLKKLGLKKEHRVRLLHQPPDYFKWLETDISGQIAGSHEVPDWVHLFASSRAVYEKEMRPSPGSGRPTRRSSSGFPGIKRAQGSPPI